MDELEVGIKVSQDDAQQAGSQAFDIMHRLRNHNVIHFNLRLANFFVSIARPLHVVIIDLRHPLDVLTDPRTLPGAVQISPEDLQKRNSEISRDGEVVLFCT